MRRTWIAALIGGILATAPPVQAASADDGGFAACLLAAHNRERARLRISGLVWSDRLAADAQRWADSLARRRAFQHAKNRGGAGENLWTGTAGAYGPEEMIAGFIGEARDFRPGRFPNVSRTGNWADVGHYTQLIWPATREVGCALARNKQDDVLVCRYWPAGNMVGQQVP